jgi:hypothetical protein
MGSMVIETEDETIRGVELTVQGTATTYRFLSDEA